MPGFDHWPQASRRGRRQYSVYGASDPRRLERLDRLLDLILTEVLQGCKFDKDYNAVRRLLGRLDLVILGGEDVVVEAARNYRTLRRLGATVRGTIDVVLATRCIVSGHQLLHSDRDFDAFERHLGLQCIGTAV